MFMTVLIRQLRPDDVSAVVLIEYTSFSDPWERSIFVRLASESTFHSAALFGAGDVRAFVMEDNAEIIGYIIWTEDILSGVARVINIAVTPTRRQQGNGRTLMQFVFERLREAGMSTVLLEARESNYAARHLYEKMGMQAIQRVKWYYGDEDAIVYAIEL